MNGNRNKKTTQKGGSRSRYLWIGGVLSGFMVLLILVSFFWTPYGTTAMDAAVKFSPPTLQHIMGCDSYGRDIFSRILEGAGTSFLIAVCVVLIGVIGSAFWHPFFWLSAFVGAGLVFAGISGFCGLGVLLSHMPWNRR